MGLIMVMLAVMSVVIASSPDVQAASAGLPGLIGGQYGSEDFTNLEHMASLDSLERSFSEDDDFGHQWSGIWQGSIVAPASGKITFTAETNQSIRILISGKQVVAASAAVASGTVSMVKGKAYPIEVRYVHEGGDSYDSHLKVQWSWAGQAAVSIDAANLSHTQAQEQQWSQKAQAAEEADDDDDNNNADNDEGDAGPVVAFKYVPMGLDITIGGKPFASYFTGTSVTPRPFFANVKTPSGMQVTRHCLPIEGQDSMDHFDLHPGIWLTFAGINGNDYWRLKQRTEHEMFLGKPQGGPGKGTFTVSNFYLDSKKRSGNRIAHEICKYTIVARKNYSLLIYDSTISSDEHDLQFGDDQEYGLGIRVQTPIEERHGGQILNAEGLTKAEEGPSDDPGNLYGKASNWCDYSGVMDDTLIGMTIMPDPNNFRRSWYHARDYGLLAANPFGRNKVAGLPREDVLIKKGQKLHLGFGIAIYSGVKGSVIDRNAMYKDYLEVISKQK